MDTIHPKFVEHPKPKLVPNFEAHNTLFDLFTQGGLIVVLSFIWIVAAAFWAAYRTGQAGLPTLLCGLCIYAVATFILRHPVFWFVIALCLVAKPKPVGRLRSVTGGNAVGGIVRLPVAPRGIISALSAAGQARRKPGPGEVQLIAWIDSHECTGMEVGMQLMDRTGHTIDPMPFGPDFENERQDGKRTIAPEPNFLQVIGILRRRSKLILTAAALGTILAGITGLLITPKYTATAQILPGSGGHSPQPGGGTAGRRHSRDDADLSQSPAARP